MNKSILHLICGLPGSGKSTLAKQLEAETGAVRFTPDEWIKSIWPENETEAAGQDYRDQIEQLQWKIGRRILASGKDIIIEWGTWGQDEREKLRDEAWEMGSEVKFYYLEVSRAVMKKRIQNRNQALGPDEFYLADDRIDSEIDRWIGLMQVPQLDELSTYDYLG